MGTIVKTVGTNGRQYSTLAAAAASLPSNFVTDGNAYVLELYNDSEFTSGINLTGITTSSTFNLTIRCAAGHSFRDHVNKDTNDARYDQSKGVGIRTTDGYAAAVINIGIQNVIVDGLQVSATGTGTSAYAANQNVRIRNSILQAVGRPNPNANVALAAESTSIIEDCIIIANSANSFTGVILQSTAQMINCTVVRPSNFTATGAAVRSFYGTAVVTNCALFGFSTAPAGTFAADGHNATDLSTAPGSTNNLTSLTYANQFVQTSSASNLHNFRLQSGSALINAGVTSTGNAPDGLDIYGNTRTSWDIGAVERYVPPLGAPTNVVATAGNAQVSVSFTAPVSDGGSAITGYVASWSGGQTASGSGSPIVITGVTNNVAGTATVHAVNGNGAGPESVQSNSVTPNPPPAPPTGTITSQPAVDGQSQRFVGTTTNATSGVYTLTGSNGGVTVGPLSFTVSGNAFDFTVSNLVAGDYSPTLTLTGPSGTTSVTGTSSFSVMGVSGGGVFVPATVNVDLVINGTVQSNTSNSVTITKTLLLNIQNCIQTNISVNPANTQTHQLSISNCSQANASSASAINLAIMTKLSQEDINALVEAMWNHEKAKNVLTLSKFLAIK